MRCKDTDVRFGSFRAESGLSRSGVACLVMLGRALVAAALLLLLPCQIATAQFSPQGSKLTPIPEPVETSDRFFFGQSVAIAADGNIALVGGPADSNDIGAAWVFVRDNGNWTKQAKLIATDQIGAGQYFDGFGMSVAISANGKTAVIGNPSDNSDAGAAWIFTRSGSTWSQGNKLVGPAARQGYAVAISGDGSTVIVGAPTTGAALIYVNDGSGNWSQQGPPLIGSDGVGSTYQGGAVALSYDGSTALVGGAGDNTVIGAAWVFVRDGLGNWSQQGSKLVGAGVAGPRAYQGESVALSADGNTALVGGYLDDGGVGAVWVFTRGDGVWSQQGDKLAVTGRQNTNALQGSSVAVSADGNTAIWGASNASGSAWIFERSGGVWTKRGNKLIAFPSDPWSMYAEFGTAVAMSADGNTVLCGGPRDTATIGAVWVFAQTPIVENVSPIGGSPAGGTAVTITGKNFSHATSVTFDGQPATNLVVVNAHTLTATTPAHPPGAVDVVVTRPAGSGTGSGAYIYAAAPSISRVSPRSGPSGGGTAITISGTDLNDARAVTFGGVAATSFSISSATDIVATAPPHIAGAVDVAVTTPGGTATVAGAFTYLAPSVTSVNPDSGTVAGGITVTIAGSNLTNAGKVLFGDTAAASFSVVNATTINAVAPPHALGAVQVTVQSGGENSAARKGGIFTYTAAPVLTAIAKFTGGKDDGAKPFAGLIEGKNGVLYGTTSQGGTFDAGTVFSLTPGKPPHTAWKKAVLHSFGGREGAEPHASLVIDDAGNLYGTTTKGGTNRNGVVFKLTAPDFGATILHSFTGADDGGNPYAALVQDGRGVLYGATTTGGSGGGGTVFKMAPPNYLPVILHSFSGGRDGEAPYGALAFDANGDLYGTTTAGGNAKSGGTSFKLTPAGTLTQLLSFRPSLNGSHPYGGLLLGNDGQFYGTTLKGGGRNRGTVFKMSPSGDQSLLWTSNVVGGIGPYATLVGDASGALYGTMVEGGYNGNGMVFKLTPPVRGQTAWTQSAMYKFTGRGLDGANPYGSVLLGKNHILYGTTSGGGLRNCPGGCGTVFMLAY